MLGLIDALYQPFPIATTARGQIWHHVPATRRPRHFHAEPELNLVTGGWGVFAMGEKVLPVAAGDLLWWPPGQDHVLARTLAMAVFEQQRGRAELVGELPGAQGAAPGGVQLAPGRRVAVNVDPRESDPARITAEVFGAGITRLNVAAAQQARAQAREREENQRLWQYGLLLMIVALAAEGMLGRRLG